MMENDGNEIHPLDRDYSQPVSRAHSQRTPAQRLRQFALATFATGFALVILAGILATAFRGVIGVESFASVLHQFAMVTILIGGVLLIISFRYSFFQQLFNPQTNSSAGSISGGTGTGRSLQAHPLTRLLLLNLIVFAVLVVAGYLAAALGGLPALMIINVFVTLILSLMITWIVVHRGILRGFAIGVVAGAVINVIGLTFGLAGPFFGPQAALVLIGHLATIQLSGMACAAYVSCLPSGKTD